MDTIRTLPSTSRHRLLLVPGSQDRSLLLQWFRQLNCAAPDVLRWNELYRLLARDLEQEAASQIDPPDHWLLLRHELNRLASETTLPSGAAERGFLELSGRQIRELLAEDVDPSSLANHDGDLSWLLKELYSRYVHTLESCKLIDSASVTSAVRNLLQGPQAAQWCHDHELVLFGFASLTHSQITFLRRLIELDIELRAWVPQSAMAEQIDLCSQLGQLSKSSGPSFTVRTIASGDPRQELETVARNLLLWERNADAFACSRPWPGWETIGLWVPPPRKIQAVEVLKRYGLPFRLAASMPLADTTLWRLAEGALSAASDHWEWSATSRLMASPWMGGYVPRDEMPRSVEVWRKALSGTAREAFDDVLAFSRALHRGGTALELLSALRNFARRGVARVAPLIYDDPSLDDELLRWNQSLEELERKILSLSEVVRDLGPAGQTPFSGSDAAAFLRAWAQGTTLRDGPPLGEALTLWATTPPVLHSCSVWIMTDTTAATWPGTLAESPLLDDEARERLHEQNNTMDATHLPLLAERRQQQEMLFRRMIATGEELTVLSRPMSDEEERPVEPSPFVSSARRDHWIADEGPLLDRSLEELLIPRSQPLLLPVEARAPLPWEPSPQGRFMPGQFTPSGETLRCSMSSLDEFVLCPYRFYLTAVLHYEPQRPPELLNHRKAGTAAHALWEVVWNHYLAGDGSLLALVEHHREGQFLLHYPELVENPELQGHRTRLWRHLDSSAALQTKLEQFVKPLRQCSLLEEKLPSLQRGLVTFVGRADRIDVLKDGRFIVWDYKAGPSKRYISSLQLACYAAALKASGDRRFTVPDGMVYLCMADGAFKGQWAPSWKDDLKLKHHSLKLDEFLSRSDKLFNDIASAWQSGQWLPSWGHKQACRRCAFDGLCRTRELHGDEEKDQEVDHDEV